MNYELAKELKDAGFPQFVTKWAWAPVAQKEKDDLGRPIWKDEIVPNHFQADIEFIACPTLEELIDACEEKGELLLSCYGKGRYIARVGYFVESTPAQEAAGYPQMAAHIKVEAPTLVEAVARLWLALKPKIDVN